MVHLTVQYHLHEFTSHLAWCARLGHSSGYRWRRIQVLLTAPILRRAIQRSIQLSIVLFRAIPGLGPLCHNFLRDIFDLQWFGNTQYVERLLDGLMDRIDRSFYISCFHGKFELDNKDEVLDLSACTEHPCRKLLQLSWLHVVHKLCGVWLDVVLSFWSS